MTVFEYSDVMLPTMRSLLRSVVWIASLAAANCWCRADSLTEMPRPLSPNEAIEQFRLPAGLKIELVAAEPEVIDPVAAAFDEDGRLWVVEMGDYPNAPTEGRPPQSRIKLLEDRDGDGRYETSRVFADGLLFCTGLQSWRGGVIATLAGEVAYFRDDDGDGRSDRRETWFTGFKIENSQLRANHPTLALDNQVYVANGLRDGKIVPVRESWRDGGKPLSISGMDFRFDPRTGKYDAVAGHGQFGLAFDDFGNRFVCTNRNPCLQVVLEDHYIRRNRHLALSGVVHDVSPPAEKSRLFPLSRAWTTSNLHAGQFTAACGVIIYRGDALPGEFRGNSFTCEPTANLVHRDVLGLDGVVFNAQPDKSQSEFLATPDQWFRPVNLTHGPDGALYVVDMYRAVIEHPDFMPDELKNRPENSWGNDRGRIYRIVPTDMCSTDHSRRSPGLSSTSSRELTSLLEHPNAWHRETAGRLLLERNDVLACDRLQSLVIHGKSPQARTHALWLLHGLDQLAADTVFAALHDADSRVRSHAVRLAEPWLNSHADLRQRVLALADDEDARLRFQVALTVGEIVHSEQNSDRERTLARIVLRDVGNRWIRLAVATSLADRASTMLRTMLRHSEEPDVLIRPGMVELVAELARLIGANQDATEIGGALSWLEPFLKSSHANDLRIAMLRRDLVLACINGLGQGASRRGQSLADYHPQLNADQRQCLQDIFAMAVQIAQDPRVEIHRRCQAIQSLCHASFATAGETLLKLAADKRNQAVCLAAIEALASFDDSSIGLALLTDFSQLTPAVRRAIIGALLADARRTSLLLDELEAGRMAPTAIQPDQWQRLTAHRNHELQQRAVRLQAVATPADRQWTIEKYRAALTLPADPRRGKEVFAKNCAGCHLVAGVGVNVAPDISDSREKRPEQFLVDILDPNRAIDNNYYSYTLVLADGQVLTGIVGAETASSITLRQQDNKSRTVLREDIEEQRSNGVSLMPTGLEQAISVQQMADLISYLKSWRYLAE